METTLNNKKVAIIVADGFEQTEFAAPYEALKKAGAHVDVISLKKGKVKGWNHTDWGNQYPVDKVIDEVRSGDYDALVLPGGVMNPDQLRVNEKVVKFVTEMMHAEKPVAAICHGPWTLIETETLRNRTLTSYPSIKTDLINAGVNWVDKEVVVDGNLITSRKPDDLPAFCKEMLAAIEKA